ncbi:MAG: CoB--CoM heterodisulfide reductase subunit B [Promethearchaeota archaeon]|nr:MAG: CoB--CoM heterodisulfide reductase subunit B [Candidatus Lokiarchaeota archaeon]
MTEYKMFEGCTIGNRIPFIEAASRKVFEKLGIQTSEAPFTCCPDPTGLKSFDNNVWLTMGALNLCIAEAEGKNIISLCNGCTNTLRGVHHQLAHDSLMKEKVNKELAKVGKEYKGTIDVKHFVDVLHDHLDKVKSAITKPLSGLRVAVHPGCHYMRPAEWMESDDPMRPTVLKELVAASGASVADYEEEVLCCGSAVTNAYEEHGMANLKIKMDSIKRSGADVVVVNCPACFQQFDTKQRDLGKKYETEYDIPVMYITELYALAMGYSPDEIGLKFHRTRLKSILERLGL